MQTNNKLREALENSNGLLEELAAIGEWGESAREQIAENNAALSAPPRQCDMGTAEEQTARYRKFCSDHKFLGSDSSYVCKGFGKGRCPFFNSHTKSQCKFAWAQMPYEEGGAE